MPLLTPNRSKGKLIVVEGIDGSGKSTQLSLLAQWLRSQGLAVAFSEWNSSPLVRETTRPARWRRTTTACFSLDGADRNGAAASLPPHRFTCPDVPLVATNPSCHAPAPCGIGGCKERIA